MGTTREQIIKQAQSWLGCKESDGTHKPIIDTYNAHTPLARGYKMRYTDAWCATFVSACAIKCGATDIIPTECGCGEMIKLMQAKGIWVEADNYTPSAGDLILYDWQDNGAGDNAAWPDHIGIVESVSNGVITVIEGNYSNAVKRRSIAVNGKYIRGYGVPKYTEAASESTAIKVELTELRKGAKGEEVKTLQRLLNALGYKMQNGGKTYGIDGSFGQATENAVKQYQEAKSLTKDGVVGAKTWSKLLKG